MLASMTGVGIAEGRSAWGTLRVEIRTLNSRYFDFSCRLPAALAAYEADIKAIIQRDIKRGKVTVFVSCGDDNGTLSIDETRVRQYVRAVKTLGKKLNIGGELALRDLLSIPDMFSRAERTSADVAMQRALRAVVTKALVALVRMKRREGKALASDLKRRVEVLRVHLEHIKACSAQEPALMKTRIEGRVKELLGSVAVDPQRLAQEIAFLADRADITEETVRFSTHLDAVHAALTGNGEAGKRIDFLMQELHREANTIGSKSQQVGIAHDVIAIKLELEKIKEQVQNIE